MPSFEKGDLIRYLRIRKGWLQGYLLEQSGFVDLNISRIETHGRSPKDGTYTALMEALELPVETYFYSFMDDFNADDFEKFDCLCYSLNWAAHCQIQLQKATSVLDGMKRIDEYGEVNRQFIISSIARLYEIQARNPNDVLELAKEGMAITFPEFNSLDFKGDVLLFNEPQLIHSQALAHAKKGEYDKAINLLQQIKVGLTKSPQDDRIKEAHLAPVLLDLSRFLIDVGKNEEALRICIEGNNVSVKHNKGRYTPDLLFAKAKILHALGKECECAELIESVYFGYTLMRKYGMANTVKQYANEFGLGFETYDVEAISAPVPEFNTKNSPIPQCESIGELIRGLRNSAGLSLAELSKGICSVSNLGKIENNEITTNVYHLEGIMQRLGRDIGKYFDTFLSSTDFEEKQMRDELNSRLAHRRYAEAEDLLQKLKTKKAYQKGVNLQFIRLAEASIYREKNGYNDTHLEMLIKAWGTVRGTPNEDTPDEYTFDEDAIINQRLTFKEVTTVNQIAIHLCETGQQRKGLRLFEDLIKNMDKFYVDNTEKMRMYPAILYNYSKNLGRAGMRKDAFALAIEGDEICAGDGDLDMLSSFAGNRAYSLQDLGDKEKSVPIFAQAYHSSGMVGKIENQNITKQYVKKRFNIDF